MSAAMKEVKKDENSDDESGLGYQNTLVSGKISLRTKSGKLITFFSGNCRFKNSTAKLTW